MQNHENINKKKLARTVTNCTYIAEYQTAWKIYPKSKIAPYYLSVSLPSSSSSLFLFSSFLLSLGSAIGYRALVDGSWDLGRSGTCYRTSSQLTIGGPAKPISSTWIHSCASASVRRRRVVSARWPPPIIFHPANRSFQSGPTRRARGGERRRRNAVPRVNPLFRRILRGPRRSTESSSPNRVARKRPN